jgi:hypothetical protein
VKLESLVVEAGTDRPSPSSGGGGDLFAAVRWWILKPMRWSGGISVLSEEGGRGCWHVAGWGSV